MTWKCFWCYKQPQLKDLRLHQTQPIPGHRQLDVRKEHRGVYNNKPKLFNWSDHPSLITDAIENGWSRFGFTRLHEMDDHAREVVELEVSWEISPGPADFMQKIRINPGLDKVNNVSNNLSAASVIRAALPLPGPPLAFPQDAYFEITILRDGNESIGKVSDQSSKVIKEKYKARAGLESLVHDVNLKELNLNVNDDGKGEAVMFSIGLTAGGFAPLKLPGSCPGSIGFNSNGSVYLDGLKLVFPSESTEWRRSDKVIGCGFSPKEKQVIFTEDSELVHVIDCKTEEFGSPLYPTIAANTDIVILVNFGESVFSYAPANVNRTANPCFTGPVGGRYASAFGYEDSKELFSIVLDTRDKSPYTY
ncbi:hypothetical protein ACFE04_007945 [Oxalis oulophora]